MARRDATCRAVPSGCRLSSRELRAGQTSRGLRPRPTAAVLSRALDQAVTSQLVRVWSGAVARQVFHALQRMCSRVAGEETQRHWGAVAWPTHARTGTGRTLCGRASDACACKRHYSATNLSPDRRLVEVTKAPKIDNQPHPFGPPLHEHKNKTTQKQVWCTAYGTVYGVWWCVCMCVTRSLTVVLRGGPLTA